MSSYICKRKSDDDGVLGNGHWGYIYIYNGVPCYVRHVMNLVMNKNL